MKLIFKFCLLFLVLSFNLQSQNTQDEISRISEQLSETDIKQYLTLSLRLGDLHLKNKEYDKAVNSYEDCINKTLNISNNDIYIEEKKCIAYGKLGALKLGMGDLYAGPLFLNDCIKIGKELTIKGAKDIEMISTYAKSYERTAGLCKITGEHSKAYSLYEEYYNIAKKLYETNKNNREVISLYVNSCIKTGEVLYGNKDSKKGKIRFTEAKKALLPFKAQLSKDEQDYKDLELLDYYIKYW